MKHIGQFKNPNLLLKASPCDDYQLFAFKEKEVFSLSHFLNFINTLSYCSTWSPYTHNEVKFINVCDLFAEFRDCLYITQINTSEHREYLVPQIHNRNSQFHSEVGHRRWSYDYPLANHIISAH